MVKRIRQKLSRIQQRTAIVIVVIMFIAAAVLSYYFDFNLVEWLEKLGVKNG